MCCPPNPVAVEAPPPGGSRAVAATVQEANPVTTGLAPLANCPNAEVAFVLQFVYCGFVTRTERCLILLRVSAGN
jgi:hypothetical protein